MFGQICDKPRAISGSWERFIPKSYSGLGNIDGGASNGEPASGGHSCLVETIRMGRPEPSVVPRQGKASDRTIPLRFFELVFSVVAMIDPATA
jgi:hypothetical protein